ncbi:reverse transcriptase domain-containing protein [Tanacetum coccineum]
MADNRTMAQMLQAPIEGYEDAIVVPPINANNFELKQPLINLVQSNKFTGRQDPHNHLRFFNKVTSTFRHPEVPNTSIKLLLFPFSLDGEARDWLDKEPPRSILTWDDLVSKFINQYFPPSKTTYYRNEIITFYQKPNEAFNEAWERFKGLLRQCPHHGFSELHQLDTFYNSLNSKRSRCLEFCSSGQFLGQNAQETLLSRLKMTIKMNQMMSQMKALVTTPAPVKAVEEVCVTCGSNHNFNNCPLTRGGNDFPVFQDNIQQFQQTAAVGNFLQRNQPSNLASQMRPPGFNQPNVQTNQNRYQGTNSNFNQNRGGNFNQNRQNNQNQVYQTPTNQPPINQVLPYQPPTNSVLKTDFENYVKANDAVLKNVQNQGTLSKSNRKTNLCQQINAITTRSGHDNGIKKCFLLRKYISLLTKDIGRSSGIDDEVVQDQRQRDDNDLQDERQDQPKEEEVEPRRCKRARTEKLFGPDFVSFMVENEPTSYREAVTSSEWLNGMKPLKVK